MQKDASSHLSYQELDTHQLKKSYQSRYKEVPARKVAFIFSSNTKTRKAMDSLLCNTPQVGRSKPGEVETARRTQGERLGHISLHFVITTRNLM